VDVNGIHSTKVKFCGCIGASEHITQLMKAKLFPATFLDPKMAFTFSLLRSYRVHHLESAITAYNYCAALQHLTDDTFYAEVPDPYSQFRNAVKFWRLLVTEIDLGQVHGIDAKIPAQPPGSLVNCGSCPKLFINIDLDELDIPPELRHLIQFRQTGDGNFHSNHYVKNTDPDNTVSVFKGRAQFPHQTKFKAYVAGVPEKDLEKSTCSYLNAVNKQDLKKFRGMDVTGVLNIQCAHCFILSSVDMHRGEQFSITDYAWVEALYQQLLSSNLPPDVLAKFIEACSFLFSYDINCAYSVHVRGRVEKKFGPEVADLIGRFKFLIPLLHIQNHKDNCTYCFSSAYAPNAGHFHGETAEHAWPYVNEFGAQCRQMSNGNQQDTYIDVYNHWNRKKLVNLCEFVMLSESTVN
jgi:hypothetical protein